MKKTFLLILMLLMTISLVSAANVGIVIEFPDGIVHKECVGISEDNNGYQVLERSSLAVEWSEYVGWGHFICGIAGIGGTVSGGICMPDEGYWIASLPTSVGWQNLPVGMDTPGEFWNRDFSSYNGHYCAKEGDILGLIIGNLGDTPDVYYDFLEVCENKLAVKDVKIYVDDDKNSADEDGGKIKDVLPGSILDIQVKVENLFTEDEDVEIRNIQVKAIIEEIDDGDDEEDEADDFDLDPEDEDTADLRLKVPYDVKDKNFDMTLTVEGTDENGAKHKVKILYDVNIEKEDEEVTIKRIELDPEFVECRRTAELYLKLINTGQDDLDCSVEIRNTDLNLQEIKKFGLDEEDTKELSFDINTFGAKNGVYPITIIFDFDYDTITETVDLEVFNCEETQTVVLNNHNERPETIQFQATGFAGFEPEKEDFFETQSWQIIVLVFGIIGVIIGLMLVLNPR